MLGATIRPSGAAHVGNEVLCLHKDLIESSAQTAGRSAAPCDIHECLLAEHKAFGRSTFALESLATKTSINNCRTLSYKL